MNDFCSGEKFSKLCDVSIYSKKYLDTFKNIKENTNKIIFAGSDITPDILHIIKTSKTFFVKSEHILYFSTIILPHIKKPFILVSHNSDKIVGNNNKILHNPYLIKWFGQNMTPHQKTIGIPIGLENSQYKGSNYQILIKYKNNPKTKLLYLNFSLKTNHRRKNTLKIFLKNNFTKNEKLPWEEYINELSKHKFAVCPLGNGPDTHRLWECIYLGVIPIVEKTPFLYPHFKDLPILFIDKYQNITHHFLENYKLKNYSLKKSTLSFWSEIFNCF